MDSDDLTTIQLDQQHTKPTLTPTPTIAEITPLPEPKEGHKATESTIRLMKKAWAIAQVTNENVRVHVDGGANRSITNNKNQLIKYKNIKKYPMSGVSSEGPALVCTGVGYFPWRADNGEIVLVKCFYSEQAADTIISPTDIVVNNITNFDGWGQHSNLDDGTGYVEFYRRNGVGSLRYTLHPSNGLWFYQNNINTEDYDVWSSQAVLGHPIVHRLGQAASYALGHERYAHCGQRALSTVHLDLDDDQPPLTMPPFWKCLTCLLATGDQRPICEHNHVPLPQDITDWIDDPVTSDDNNCLPGQRFNIDFGFMKGTGYCSKDEEGRTITVLYMDSVTKKVKTATHVIFEEAGLTLPAAQLTPSAKALQKFGYNQEAQPDQTDAGANLPMHCIIPATQPTSTDDAESLLVKCLSLHATLPTRATDGSAGYDLYSAVDTTIQPHSRCCVPIDITIVPPAGTYGQILSRSGLAAKHHIDVKAGTIDRDYTGNIQVLLENNGDTPYNIAIGDRIAQMVLLQLQTPEVSKIEVVPDTARGNSGFGSTGISAPPPDQPCIRTNAAEQAIENPYDIFFSHDPIDNTMEIEVAVRGDHPTLGILSQYCPYRQRLQIKDMALSTPGSRIKKWRSTHAMPIYSKCRNLPSLMSRIWSMQSSKCDKGI
mmetsp:Transcript_29198/g.41777  ORF Transcript_29198/g.41777 Transcript_29198/m.41777 type:complete len:656 (+) Transcript_29198:922-2889(+)